MKNFLSESKKLFHKPLNRNPKFFFHFIAIYKKFEIKIRKNIEYNSS